MKKGIFITGTDTGVGKTFVAAGLIRAFTGMGFSVSPMKPVETGCGLRRGRLVPQDSMRLIAASKVKESLDTINPYRLRLPLAPSVAAGLEGVIIKKKKILSFCHHLMNKYDLTVVEGAGGIMVPVSGRYLFLELIRDLDLPVVIISRPGLGTINHTLLTIEAARLKGIRVLGTIINHSTASKKGLAEKTSPKIIEALGRRPLLGIVPYSKSTTGRSVMRNFEGIAENILARL
jgi:dethiobiotin synthetase